MLLDAHVRGETGVPGNVVPRTASLPVHVGTSRRRVYRPMANVHGRIVHVYDDDGISQLRGRHEMRNGDLQGPGLRSNVFDVLQLPERSSYHVPDHETYANRADVHARKKLQHRDDALHPVPGDDAVYGHEGLPDVHRADDGTFLQTVRNAYDRLFRAFLRNDL